MSANLTAIAYLISAIFFVLALNGLSNPDSARRGNLFGIIGMLIAILTTFLSPNVNSYPMILLGILIGGTIGTFIALKIEMTSLPELVAAFHSLVGLAAVFVAASAFYSPESYGITSGGNIKISSLVEMSIGVSIGAITFKIGKQNNILHSTPFLRLFIKVGFLTDSLYVINSPYSFAIM